MKIIERNLPHPHGYTRRSQTTEIILHHAEAKSASVEDINRWHLARDWNGIGYNYYIRKDGSIYRGRPEWAVGSHAAPHNSTSIGICCEGAYMTETMPAAQLASLKALIRDIQGRYGGKLRLLRHKDVNSTDCPGTNFPWAEAQRYNETEDEEMSYEQFKAYMKQYQTEQEAKTPSAWGKAAWEKAKAEGVTDGTAPQGMMTREMGVVMMQRAGVIGK